MIPCLHGETGKTGGNDGSAHFQEYCVAVIATLDIRGSKGSKPFL